MVLIRRQVIGAFTGAAVAAGAAFTPLTAQAGESQTAPISSLGEVQQNVTLKEACEASKGKAVFYYDPSSVKTVGITIENLQKDGFNVSHMNGPDAVSNTVLLCINGKGPAPFTQEQVYQGFLGYETERIYSALIGKPHGPILNGDEGNGLTPTVPE